MIKILLLRDLTEIKRNITSFIVILSLLPMILHLLIVIPFSLVLNDLTIIRYLNWSVVGVWIVSASLIAFILPLSKMKRIKYDSLQLQSMLKAPLTNYQIISSIILSTMIICIIEIILAMIFTTFVNNQYLNSLDYLIIFSQLLPIVIFFSILSLIIGQFINRNLSLVSTCIGMFLFISFGLGAFIPLEAYPVSVIKIIQFIPITGLINNSHLILLNKMISPYFFIITILMDLVLFGILLIVTHKSFRD